MPGGHQQKICIEHESIRVVLLSMEYDRAAQLLCIHQLAQLFLHRAVSDQMQHHRNALFAGKADCADRTVYPLFMRQSSDHKHMKLSRSIDIRLLLRKAPDLIAAVKIRHSHAFLSQLRQRLNKGPAAAV